MIDNKCYIFKNKQNIKNITRYNIINNIFFISLSFYSNFKLIIFLNVLLDE